MTAEETHPLIRTLNDQFRQTGIGGRIILTRGICELPPKHRVEIWHAVRTFEVFDDHNDPYGEHDFGSLQAHGATIFWKIDYYNPSLSAGSSDPADVSKCTRVLTIMLSDEY